MTRNANPILAVVILIAILLGAAMPVWSAPLSEPERKSVEEEVRMPVTGSSLDHHRNLVEISVTPSQMKRISIESGAIVDSEAIKLVLEGEKGLDEIYKSQREGPFAIPKDLSVWLQLEDIARSLRGIKYAVRQSRHYPYTIGIEFNAPIQGVQAVTHTVFGYDDAKTILADLKTGAIKSVSVYTQVGSGMDPQSGKPTTWKACQKCVVVVFGY